MKVRTVIGSVLIVLLVIFLVFMIALGQPKARCEEDQACWDCHTMGNKVCGP